MSHRQGPWGKQTRQRVALEAARIMAQEHLSDYSKARKKAVDRLGITLHDDMPTNQEIEQELIAYRSMFFADESKASLAQQREAAIEAMRFFERFNPRLVGSVLEGSADRHDDVQLHLFAHSPDDVVFFLMEKGIEYDQRYRTVKYKSGQKQEVSCFEFNAGGQPFSILVFSEKDIRHAPLSTVTGQPMQRADIKKVSTLLQLD